MKSFSFTLVSEMWLALVLVISSDFDISSTSPWLEFLASSCSVFLPNSLTSTCLYSRPWATPEQPLVEDTHTYTALSFVILRTIIFLYLLLCCPVLVCSNYLFYVCITDCLNLLRFITVIYFVRFIIYSCILFFFNSLTLYFVFSPALYIFFVFCFFWSVT